MFSLTSFLRYTLTYRSRVGRLVGCGDASLARSLPLLRSLPSTARITYHPGPPPASIHGQHHLRPTSLRLQLPLAPHSRLSHRRNPIFLPRSKVAFLRWICGERRHGAGASCVWDSGASTSTPPSSRKAAVAELGATMSLLSTLLETRAGSAP
jgi:hypothetical protein